jgi:hypothetical protein
VQGPKPAVQTLIEIGLPFARPGIAKKDPTAHRPDVVDGTDVAYLERAGVAGGIMRV